MVKPLLICLSVVATLLVSAQESDYDKAIRTYQENKLDSARLFINSAITTYQREEKEDSLVLANVQKALVVWDTEGLDAAFHLMLNVKRTADRLPGRSVARVAAYSRIGQLHVQRHEFTQANLFFSEAERLVNADLPHRHYVLLYNYIAMMHLMQDQYEPADRYAKKAYAMNLDLEGKDGANMPALLQMHYFISLYRENYQQALADGLEFQRVIQLKYPPNHPKIGVMHNSLAIIYETLRQYDEALIHRQKAVDIHRANYIKTSDGYSLAAAYQNIGNLYSYINEPFLAQEYLAKGSRLLMQTFGEDGLGMVKVFVDLAVNKYKVHEYHESEELFKRAYALQQKYAPNDLLGMAYVETFFGTLYFYKKEFPKAVDFYKLALQRYGQGNAMHTEIALSTKEYLAKVMAEVGEPDESIKMQQTILKDFRAIYPYGNDVVANKLQGISESHLSADRIGEAYAYSDSVFMELLMVRKLPEEISEWVPRLPFSYNTSVYISHRMRVLEQLHATSKNRLFLEELLELADQYGDFIAKNLHAFRTQATLIDLADTNKKIYSMAMEACWSLSDAGRKQSSLMERAFAYAERSKALLLRLAANNMLVDVQNQEKDPVAKRDHDFRKRINTLNLQYLNSDRNDSLLTLLTSTTEQYRIFQDSLKKSNNETLSLKHELNPYAIGEIRKKLLRHHETLIEYAVTGKSVFIFVITPKAFHVRRVDKEVLKDVEHLRDLYGLAVTSFIGPAYRLYESLVKPVESYFVSKRLLIIPDADLYYLNFEVLISHQKEGRFSRMPYLICTYELSYLLSATSAIQFKEAYRLKGKKKALLVAPVFTDEMKANYQKSLPQQALEGEDYLYLYRQPFALQAAMRIGRLISHDLFAEQQAEERMFKRAAPNYGILHLGTHAEVNNQSPLQSRFFFAKALADDTLNTDDGYLHAYEIYSMQLRAELAVLTACETGTGAWRNGEGVISLAHSFMHAGCPGVVMSLWKIDEKTSTDIITRFYEYLSKGYNKSEALQKAKLHLLNQRNERLSHPYYWAGLALIGERAPIYSSYNWWFWLVGVAGIALIGWILWKRKRVNHGKSTEKSTSIG